GQDTLAYQDLAGLGLGTETGGEVCDRADGGIVEATLEADLAKRGVALGDADTKSQLMTVLAPSLRETRRTIAHRDSHSNRSRRRIRAGNWIVEQHHEPIAQKAFQRSLEAMDNLGERSVILAQSLHHLFRLGRSRRKR